MINFLFINTYETPSGITVWGVSPQRPTEPSGHVVWSWPLKEFPGFFHHKAFHYYSLCAADITVSDILAQNAAASRHKIAELTFR